MVTTALRIKSSGGTNIGWVNLSLTSPEDETDKIDTSGVGLFVKFFPLSRAAEKESAQFEFDLELLF